MEFHPFQADEPESIQEQLDHIRDMVDEISSMPAVEKDRTITPELFADMMRNIAYVSTDTEASHVGMDRLMCDVLRSMGYDEGICVFEKASKWYA